MICVGVYCNDITHSWLQFVTVIKHGVHCKGANRTVSVETDNLQSLCLILHACIHLSVWCHDSLQVMLKFQVHILETVNLKEIMDSVSHILRPFFRAMAVCWSLSITMIESYSSSGSVSAVSLSRFSSGHSAAYESTISWISASFKQEKTFLEKTLQANMRIFFQHTGWKIPEVFNCFKPHCLPAANATGRCPRPSLKLSFQRWNNWWSSYYLVYILISKLNKNFTLQNLECAWRVNSSNFQLLSAHNTCVS